MTYFGLSSSSAVSSLFDTSSTSYTLLKSKSEYNTYATLNKVSKSLKSQLSQASTDDAKTSIQNKLDAITETLQSNAPTASTSYTVTEQAAADASEILASMGIGSNVNTTV